MSWNTFHRRGETLRAVVETANERRDGILPMEAPGVVENFADELDLIGALQLKWHARLSGNLERTMMREPMDLEAAVVRAWRTTAAQMAGVRLVIDRCAAEPSSPEMAAATGRAGRLERARLATAAGLANGHDDAAVEVGRRIEEKARRGMLHEAIPEASPESGDTPSRRAPRAGRHAASESFVDRVRAALATA